MEESAFTVLPAGVLDASHATDSIILAGWVLDKPIDIATVKTAWSTLIDTWPLLVARLYHDPGTKTWAYHVPVRPVLHNSFASLQISAPVRQHYRYSTPSAEIAVTFKQNPHHLFCPFGPTSISDLLDKDQDRPLVHLHVTVFDDATLVGLSTPHILCDGHGVTLIVRTLTDLINGGARPRALDYTDPFSQYSPEKLHGSEVPAPPFWRVLGRIETLAFYIRTVWAGFWEDKIENRDIYIPQSEVLRIKERAMQDIRHIHGNDTTRYISSSDAVLALCLQHAHRSTRSGAPLNIFYTANLRPFLSNMTLPYLRNTVLMPITPPLPLSSISQMSVGALALHIRDTLTREMTQEARDRWLRWRLYHGGEDKLKVFFDPWRGAWDVVTNWREMGLMKVDFSGALLKDGRRGTLGEVRCVYAWGNGLQPYPLKNWFGLWADDADGGMWASAFLQRRVWEDARGFGQFIRK